jgi:thymidine kinase
VAYIFKDDKYKTPKLHDKLFGKYKLVKDTKIDKKGNLVNVDRTKYYIKDTLKFIEKEAHKPEVMSKKFDCKYDKPNIYGVADIEKLIKEKKSFQLDGRAGFGKSYQLEKTILPLLKDMKIIITSTTKAQGCDLAGKLNRPVRTIQSLFSRNTTMQGMDELFRDIKFKDEKTKSEDHKGIEWIIIDEAVQLSQDLLKKLEYVKLRYNLNIIALTDKYQCVTDYYNGEPYIVSRFGYSLMDNNVVEIKKHKNMRYDDKIYNIIEYIIENWDDKDKVVRHVASKIKCEHEKKNKNKFNLAYTNKKCASVFKCDVKKCSPKKCDHDESVHCYTTHSIQGRTIAVDYSIHEITKMPVEVIYTAISRARKIEQITLI